MLSRPGPSRPRLGVLATSSLLLAGCGEMQPAVPLEQSIPLATFMLAVVAVPSVALSRSVWRRTRRPVDPATGWPLPFRAVRRTVAVATASAAVMSVSLAGLAFYLTGLAFAEAHVGIFTYADAVGFSALLLGCAAAVWCLLLGVAAGLCSPSATVRGRTRVVAALAAVAAALSWLLIPVAVVLAVLLFTSRHVAPEPPFVSGPAQESPPDGTYRLPDQLSGPVGSGGPSLRT